MPLASFTVERYRSFVRPTRVALRPLTLLFGYNSAGKSALLRALPLLAASSGGATLGPLALDAEVAREATYKEIRTRLKPGSDLMLAAAWDDDLYPVRQVEVHLRADNDRSHVVDRLVLRDAAGSEIVRATDVPGEPGRYQVEASGEPTAIGELPFEGVRPAPRADLQLSPGLRAGLEAGAARLVSLQEAVHWLGAVRASPERNPRYQGVPARLGGTGKRAGDRLAYDHQGAGKLFPEVESAVRKMFGHRLVVRDEQDKYALELEPFDGLPVRVSIVDAGEGITQVLPVLVLGAMARAGDLGVGAVLALEQPEMHLHPQAERALATFLCDIAAASTRPRMLVETHSENLLLSVQLEVARGRLSPADVSILWVEVQADGQSQLREVTLDAEGRPSGWPPGVFSEDAEIARELFLARRNPRS